MTFIEILISTFVFTLTLAALLQSLTMSLYLTDLAKERNIAVYDLRDMMEEIRATPFANMVALFPNSLPDGPVGNPYASIVGGYMLQNEQITVSYVDVNSDPIEIEVDLTWQDRRGRNHSISGFSFKTK